MVGAIRYKLEAGEGKGEKGGGNSGTRGSTCGGDGDTRIGNGSGFRTSPHEGVEHRHQRGEGVTGGQWLQRGRRQNTVAQFIATRPILGLYEVAERRRETRVPQRWWEKSGIAWKLAREKGAGSETTPVPYPVRMNEV